MTPTLGAYDLIIGRDLMEFLGIDIRFSTQEIEWDNATVPFKDTDEIQKGLFHVDDPAVILEEHECIKKILDAKYKVADLEQVCREQEHLSPSKQQKLLSLLSKYETLFDGTLGKWTGSKVSLDTMDGATVSLTTLKSFLSPECTTKLLNEKLNA